MNPEWQTKQDYKTDAVTLRARKSADNTTKVTKILGILTGALFALYFLIIYTPLGTITTVSEIDNRSGKTITADPLTTVILILAIISVFVFLSFNIYRLRAHNKSVSLGVVLLVVAVVAIANPVSGLFILFLILCGFSPCQSS